MLNYNISKFSRPYLAIGNNIKKNNCKLHPFLSFVLNRLTPPGISFSHQDSEMGNKSFNEKRHTCEVFSP